MGIYSGTVGISRYKVIGDASKQTHASLSKLLLGHKSPAIKLDGPAKPEILGWVKPLLHQQDESFSDDTHWDMSECQTSEGYLLRLRYERRKVPTALQQIIFKSKLKEYEKETGKRPNKNERQKLKQEISLDLVKRTLPVFSFIDILWRIDAGELLVFSNSKSARQRVELLFHQTFGTKLHLTLLRLDGPTALFADDQASEKDLSKTLSRLASLEPVVFAARQAH